MRRLNFNAGESSPPPLVYGGYTQAELDRQYDAAGTVPSTDPYFEEWAAASKRTRTALHCELDVAYGAGERERLDLFPAARPAAPCFVWVHGGYWRRLAKSFFSFVAEPIVAAGGAAVIVNYPLVASATLDEIVDAARRALAWIARNAARLNADARHIVVGGHSAGGQLAGMLAATDWRPYGLPEDSVKGVFVVSGLFDLEPVRLSAVNEWLRIDAEGARRNSPAYHLPTHALPLVAVAGSDETFEFKEQSRNYAAAWSALGYPARYLEPAGHNHFSIVGDLADSATDLSQRLLEFVI